jgi:Uma2 family endonuclease
MASDGPGAGTGEPVRERLAGVLHAAPPPSARRRAVTARLVGLLRAWASDGLVVRTGHLRLGPADLLRPEAHVTRGDGPPLLVVVVADGEQRALAVGAKRRLVEAHGVAAYWVVDLEAERVEVWRRTLEGPFDRPVVLGAGDVVGGGPLEGLGIEVGTLLAPDGSSAAIAPTPQPDPTPRADPRG